MDDLTSLASLRKKFLEERGLEVTRARPKTAGKIRRKRRPPSRVPARLKTKAMRLHELEIGKPIEVILTDGSLREVAEKYGLTKSTVYNWKHTLKLIWSETNLP